jgi:hypothetical protein
MATEARRVYEGSQCVVWRRDGHLAIVGLGKQGDWELWLKDETALALAMMIVDAYIEELAALADE